MARVTASAGVASLFAKIVWAFRKHGGGGSRTGGHNICEIVGGFVVNAVGVGVDSKGERNC